MSAKFTPGPWEMGDYYATGIYVWDENQDRCVALVEDCDVDHSELEANARLIAAAPKLLEALESLVAEINHEPNSEFGFPSLERATATIAEAKGETK